jgi:hypothetical protein
LESSLAGDIFKDLFYDQVLTCIKKNRKPEYKENFIKGAFLFVEGLVWKVIPDLPKNWKEQHIN